MSASAERVAAYWGRDNLGTRILDALAGAGKNLAALTIDDLAPVDQFHAGGKAATVRLARMAGFKPRTRVLDVGGGLGGPARTLAVEFGCRVTVLDLTESYIQAGRLLTDRLGLAARVEHHVGDALHLSFDDASFDAVWTQNSGMNIENKAALYQGIHRVLRPRGTLAMQEPMAGLVQPLIFPTMWAEDAATSFLGTPGEMRAVIESTGFRVNAWDDVPAETPGAGANATPPSYGIQQLVMGDRLAEILRAGVQNRQENRVVLVQAVFLKV
jgi:SAM-dependent methyltransferase